MPFTGTCRRMAVGRYVCLRLLAVLPILPARGFSFSDLVPSMGSAQKHATDELDDTTFDTFMKEHPVSAILLYAPWCIYSQQMLPSWDTAAARSANLSGKDRLASVLADRRQTRRQHVPDDEVIR